MLMCCVKRAVFILLFILTFSVITPALLFSQDVAGNDKNTDHDPRAAGLVIQGAVFDLNGEYSKALIAYNEAFIYAPDSPSICNSIAKDYVYLGKLETSLQMLQRSLKIDPNYLETHQLLAKIYQGQSNVELATEEYLEILRLDPQNVDAHFNLASLYLSQNKTKQATELYDNLLNLGLATRESHFQLGNLYFQQKEYEQAQKVFEQYITTYPEDEGGYLAIGAVFTAKKDTAATIEWYEKRKHKTD